MSPEPTFLLVRGWKTKAKQRCREIVAKTPDGRHVTDNSDENFLRWLITRHPEAALKTGCGIAYFSARSPSGYTTRCLQIVRTDGSVTDFSWQACITEPSPEQRIRAGMRKAVKNQVLAFKHARDDSPCEKCGQPCSSNAEADHCEPSFLELANRYAESLGGYQNIKLEEARDGLIGNTLSSWHETVFAEYHRQAARLRILCGPCHHEVTARKAE